MIFGTYTFTEVFGIPYEWAEMPRWYIIAGQVSVSITNCILCVFCMARKYFVQFQVLHGKKWVR